MAFQLERISSAQLAALPREKTVFFFAVGPLEDHGPHLPLGLDLIEAERLCLLAAEKLERDLPGWTGVVMPRAPIGVDASTTALAFTTRGYVLRDWLIDCCEPLARAGFRHFACFTGQLGPKQLSAIEEAGRMIRKRHGGGPLSRHFRKGRVPTFASASSALVSRQIVFESPLWPDPAEHGGARDTSVALSIAPNLVDQAFEFLPERKRADRLSERAWLRMRRKVSGYWGRPSDARIERGRQTLDGSVADVFTELRAVWEGASPDRHFRSWYSAFPPNRSFFKAWLLALGLAVILMFWFYLSLRGFA